MGKFECKSEIYMTTNLTVATASGNESCILQDVLQRNKQRKMEKRFYDLRFCDLLRGNKQARSGEFLADMIVINDYGFDVVLGMDWLGTSYTPLIVGRRKLLFGSPVI